MTLTEDRAELLAALLGVQAALTNPPPTGVNPHFRSRYVELGAVLDLVRPALAEHGLVLLQDVAITETAVAVAITETAVVVTTALHHTSGQHLVTEPLPIAVDGTDAQALGAAISYGRRYQLMTLLGLAAGDSEDAGRRKGKDGGKPPSAPAAQPDGQYVAQKRGEIRSMLVQIVGDDDQERLDAELLRLTKTDTFAGWKSLEKIRSKKAADITAANVKNALEDLDLDQHDDGDPNVDPREQPPALTDDDIPF